VPGQSGQAEDEQQGSDDVGRGRGGDGGHADASLALVDRVTGGAVLTRDLARSVIVPVLA
jgi:hypothetical protein